MIAGIQDKTFSYLTILGCEKDPSKYYEKANKNMVFDFSKEKDRDLMTATAATTAVNGALLDQVVHNQGLIMKALQNLQKDSTKTQYMLTDFAITYYDKEIKNTISKSQEKQ